MLARVSSDGERISMYPSYRINNKEVHLKILLSALKKKVSPTPSTPRRCMLTSMRIRIGLRNSLKIRKSCQETKIRELEVLFVCVIARV